MMSLEYWRFSPQIDDKKLHEINLNVTYGLDVHNAWNGRVLHS